MNKNVVSIGDSREPCTGCRNPVGKEHYVAMGRFFCPECYDFLQLSAEEKALYMEKVRNEKQCSTCKMVKNEGIRSFTFASGEITHLCTECIKRAAPSASEKWSMNQLEMRTKTNIKTE